MSDFNDDGFDDLAIGVLGEDVESHTRAGAANVLYGSLLGLDAMGNQLWHQDVPGIEGGAEAEDGFGSALASGDFNDDGFDDLAIGVSGEAIGTLGNAGAVNLLFGSTTSLTATDNQLWQQNSPGVQGSAEADDLFGDALASGDFNGDGFDDLAIGARGEDIGTVTSAGAVHVLLGSLTGLSATGNQFWEQNTPGVQGDAESGDTFGDALAIGDFNNDGFDDLAIGASGENVGTVTNAGAVNLLRGSATGLTPAGNQFWAQSTPGVQGNAEANDSFGSALASGDFNGDGFDDLAIGVSGENIGTVTSAGAVNVLRGSVTGLTTVGNQFWEQNTPGVLGGAESGDGFGNALAVGDFNNDGFDDLAIGVSGENVGTVTNAGAVNVIFGSATGLTVTGNELWHQNVPGVQGGAEIDDAFGDILRIGDFNDDGFDDLAIGAPGESIGTVADAGATHVLFGGANGLTSMDNQIWDQNTSGIIGVAQADDFFGGALA